MDVDFKAYVQVSICYFNLLFKPRRFEGICASIVLTVVVVAALIC